jgi:hypothetical protein
LEPSSSFEHESVVAVSINKQNSLKVFMILKFSKNKVRLIFTEKHDDCQGSTKLNLDCFIIKLNLR